MANNDINIRIDFEIKRFLDGKKLIKAESYKSVLKRLLKGGKNGNKN